MSLCRICASPLNCTFADLGMSPLSNGYLKPERLNEAEKFYPLRAYVCEHCLLVQLEEFEHPGQIFSDYAYFSSYSTTWLEHCRRYSEDVTARFGLDQSSQVVEIASNDGYLLQYFRERGIPVLGVEPAANVAAVARERGIPTRVCFLGAETARQMAAEGIRADLLLGNNVLAHVPDLLSFIEGLQVLLAPKGVLTLEFPHLLQMIRHRQFDTIYHEHFSYFSLLVVRRAFAGLGLEIFDVEELPTHGGSLRIYCRHREDKSKPSSARVECVLRAEVDAGMERLDAYRDFAEQVKDLKCDLLQFFIQARREHKRVAGYGAPAKGNTLLNYCGIGPDLLAYTVDRSPHKQGLYLPGTHIPVKRPEAIFEDRPDYVLILPWNLRDEIAEQMAGIREWGGRFVVPIPRVEVFG